MSQTWLASHTGPDAGVDEGANLTAALVESGGEIVEARAEVGAREQCVHDDADEHRHRHHRCQRHDTVSSRGGPYGLGRSVSPVRHRLRHGTQHDVRPDRHAQIDDEDAEVAPPEAGVRAGGVVGAQYLPHRPRLTADFGGNPTEFHRKDRPAGPRSPKTAGTNGCSTDRYRASGVTRTRRRLPPAACRSPPSTGRTDG